MTTDFDSSTAFDEAFAAANSRVERMLGVIAERLGQNASARAVFGEPVERDGITIIPVAKVRMGFGAGGGSGSSDDDDSGEGGGGGGGTSATPLGYIEISAAGAEFRPIRSFADTWPAILALGAATFLVLRGLRAVFH